MLSAISSKDDNLKNAIETGFDVRNIATVYEI